MEKGEDIFIPGSGNIILRDGKGTAAGTQGFMLTVQQVDQETESLD